MFVPFANLSAPDSEEVVGACGTELQVETGELLTEYKCRGNDVGTSDPLYESSSTNGPLIIYIDHMELHHRGTKGEKNTDKFCLNLNLISNAVRPRINQKSDCCGPSAF